MATVNRSEADVYGRLGEISDRLTQLREQRNRLAARHQVTTRGARTALDRASQALAHAAQMQLRAAECHAQADRTRRRVADFLDRYGPQSKD